MAMHRTKPQTAAVGFADPPGRARRVDRREDVSVEANWRRRHRRLRRWTRSTNVTIVMAHGDHRLVDADVSRERQYPGRAASPPGRGTLSASCVPGNISRTPRTWLERTTNLVRFDAGPAWRALRRRSKSPSSTRRNCVPFFRRYRAVFPPTAGHLWCGLLRQRCRCLRHRRRCADVSLSWLRLGQGRHQGDASERDRHPGINSSTLHTTVPPLGFRHGTCGEGSGALADASWAWRHVKSVQRTYRVSDRRR